MNFAFATLMPRLSLGETIVLLLVMAIFASLAYAGTEGLKRL